MRTLTFFFFGDHPNFRLLFQIRTLGSIIMPSNALYRPAFVREIIEVSINLVKSVMLHRGKKRDFRSKKRDKASKSVIVPPKAGRMVTLTKEHIKKCSSCKTQPNNMGQFKIIRKCQTSYEAKIHEALVIKRSNPVLNKQLYANGASILLNVF